MIDDKLKALLKLYQKSYDEAAEGLGINYQSFANKMHRKSFKADDLIKIANITGTRLAFIDQDGRPVIVLDKNDIS